MPYQRVTLDTFRDQLLQRTDTSLFWTADEARLAINEALRLWNLLTGRWRRRVTVTILPADVRVSLPSTLTYGMRVRTPDGLPLNPTSLTELDLAQPQWRQERTTDGGGIPTRPTDWAPESLTSIVIWPTTLAGGTLEIDGVADTPVLVDDADWVDLGDEHLIPLADFALHVLAFKEGGPRWAATRPAWTGLLQAAAQENTRLKASQVFRRIAGLDRRRDLQPLQRGPTQLDAVATGGDAATGGQA